MIIDDWSIFEGYYGLILADPPWKFRTWSETNQQKAASKHYSLMGLDDICALPVAPLAAPDCALVVWGVQAMVPQLFEVVRCWGFEQKSLGVWAKRSKTGAHWAFGTGYLQRCAAEFYCDRDARKAEDRSAQRAQSDRGAGSGTQPQAGPNARES